MSSHDSDLTAPGGAGRPSSSLAPPPSTAREAAPDTPVSGEPRPRPRLVTSSELLGPKGILYIHHGDEVYILRETRNRRLILSK